MKIVIENKIPYIQGLLEPYGEVVYLAPEDITAEAVRDADALFVRTRTRVDAGLLEGSRVKFVATATIGTDHIDLDYCRRRGVTAINAPGCNAPAVAQYVFAALDSLEIDPEGKTLGVVGVGHVGRLVEAMGRERGWEVLRCDPPRARVEGEDGFTDLATLMADSDVVTFHVPITREGEDATYHLCNRLTLNQTQRTPLIINAARGPVVDTAALVDALRSGLVSGAVIDCWEGEPKISLDLLNMAAIATPHIAGYSREGKQRATAMVVSAFLDYLGLEGAQRPDCPAVALPTAPYDISRDDAALRREPYSFEKLRNTYKYRDEN